MYIYFCRRVFLEVFVEEKNYIIARIIYYRDLFVKIFFAPREKETQRIVVRFLETIFKIFFFFSFSFPSFSKPVLVSFQASSVHYIFDNNRKDKKVILCIYFLSKHIKNIKNMRTEKYR